jgi:hypothetical protein
MALILNADGEYVARTTSLGSGNYYWSVGGSYEWDGGGATRIITQIIRSGGGAYVKLEVGATGLARVYTSSFDIQSPSVQLVSGQYGYFAIDFRATTMDIHIWPDGASSSVTTVSLSHALGQLTPGSVSLGCSDGSSPTAYGSYSHWRYFNAGETASTGSPNGILGATKWNQERTSATPVNNGAYLIENWKLVTNGNGDGGLDMSATGSVAYSADEPSYIGASGSSIAPLAAYYRMLRSA